MRSRLLGRVVSSAAAFFEARTSYARQFTTTLQAATSMTNSHSSRTVANVVAATPSGPIFRLVGTVDIDGKGTQHSLAAVDPFMLLDYATIPKPDFPPFGAHPHRGHSVVTVLLQGAVQSWDSCSNQRTVVQAPASYWVDAGSGLFHDEVSVMSAAAEPAEHVKLMQLWVSVQEVDRQRAPRVQYDTALPAVDGRNAAGKVVGRMRYHVGGPGSKIETPHPIVVAHVTQEPATKLIFPVDPSFGGFVVNIQGDLSVGGGTKSTKAYDVMVLEDAKSAHETVLEISTTAAAEYLVCVGEKVQQDWYKKLAASGAIIAKTPDEAREIAAQIEVASAKGKETGDFSPFGVAKE